MNVTQLHTHCSACGRKLRKKIVGGDRYTDWLNHKKDCPRYGQDPDTRKAGR